MGNFKRRFTSLKAILVALVLCVSFEAFAAPATPKTVKVTQADGSVISLRLFGDEYFNWSETENGFTVAEKDGFYYYADYELNGEVKFSGQRVSQNSRMMAPPTGLRQNNMHQIFQSVATQRRAERSGISISSFPSEGDIKSVVILVEYFDVKFTVENPNQAFTNQLNEEGYSVAGATGSARDYFLANSGGKFHGQFDVYGPYTLSQPQRYYGGNAQAGGDLRPQDMIEEAVELADKDGVDFSQYDYDGDGKIDNVFVYYAGRSEAEGGGADCVWPHKWNVSGEPMFDGKILDVYACTSELRGASGEEPIIAGIGTFCHEFSHVFGLADHYDTTGDADGTSYGFGAYDLMTSGNYNNDGNTPPLHNALERMMIGWSEPVEIDFVGDVTLAPINEGTVYKMSTDTEGEFFLFENRVKSASVWDNYIPGEGLLITHIDQSAPYVNAWNQNRPNGDPMHECARFIIAGNVATDNFNNWEKVPYPYQAAWSVNNEFSPNSVPKAKSWSGALLKHQLTNIAKDGDNITFTVSESFIKPISGTIKDSYGNIVPNAQVKLASTTGGATFNGVTDMNGSMQFTDAVIPDDTYTITVSASGYSTYTETFTLVQGIIKNISLFTNEQALMPEVKNHNGEYSHSLGSYEQFRPMICLTAEQLQAHVGRSIEEVRIYATAEFQGQAIIQPGLMGGGWSPGPFFVETGEVGWKSIDFSGENIIIEPNTDYWVKIMVVTSTDANPAIGMDTYADHDTQATSAMIDQMGLSPISVYDKFGLEGNLMITVGLSKVSAYVAPVAFNVNPKDEDGIDLSVSEIHQIGWAAIPANGNSACKWTSSNEKVVTVNSFGQLFATGEGTATVTGVSIFNENLTMSFDVNVSSKEARGTGFAVIASTGEGVSGVELKFYPITPSAPTAPKSAAFGLIESGVNENIVPVNTDNFTIMRADENEVVTATTGENGLYNVEGLVAGVKYRIVLDQDIQTDPWISSSSLTQNALIAYVEGDENTINDFGTFELFENIVYGTSRFAYYEGKADYVAMGDIASPTIYAIKVPAESLKDKIGHEITNMDAYVYSLTSSYIESYIFTLGADGRPEMLVGTAIGDTGETAEGYHMFNFINQAVPGIIRPNTDYYVAVQLMGQVGTQVDPDNKYPGLGDLIWSEEHGRFVSGANDFHAPYYFNWQLAMYTKERAIDPVSSITIAAVGNDPFAAVGVPYQVTSTVAPATAAYDAITWSTSDEKIAKVDQNGNVTFLKEGKVSIIATSVEYPDVTASHDVNVSLIQGAMGMVINSDGNRVEGARVMFYETKMNTQSMQTLSRASYERVEGTGIEATSDEYGEFYIDLEPGVYEVEATKDGLIDYQGVVTIEYGMNAAQILMYTYVETLSDFMCWGNPGIDGQVGDEGYNFIPFTTWSAEDLAGQVGKKITRIKALVAGYANIRFVVFEEGGDVYLYRSDMIEVADGALEMVVHDLETYVTIEEGKGYCIGYEVSNYDPENRPAILSMQSTTASGKGDCIVYRNEPHNMTELAGGGVGNWAMGFYLQSDSQIEGVQISAGQRDAIMSWSPFDYTSFQLVYGEDGTDQETTMTLTDCKFEFSGLEISTKYNVRVLASRDDKEYVELFSTSFTTLGEKTTIPMIMLNAYDGYKAGNVLNLKTINTADTDTVAWFVDGEELPRATLILEAGEHMVQCRVTRGSQKFVTTRFIKVK